MNKVLVIGRGGREHALAWKFSESTVVDRVYVAPGNKGMEDVASPVDIDENDFDALADFAKKENISLTVVGPEVPLVNGIADRFRREGLTVFGPEANAAVIEGSKTFAKNLMEKHGIPTAGYRTFTDCDEACRHVERADVPIVIKADGLAAGKGVVLAQTREEARSALIEMMRDGKFGEASRSVVVEEFLRGEEFSFIAFVNGERVYPMALSQDHKRAYDNDAGPNTGGMGAYSPVPQIDDAVVKNAVDNILVKTAKAMVLEGRSFTGFLYGGLIATDSGPKVIEFNARLGDPEAQVLLPRLESDLFETIMAILREDSPLGNPAPRWSNDAVVGVVLASKGYPGAYPTGFPIEGLDGLKKDTLVFHCGTAYRDGKHVTNGGRVLVVARKAPTLALARQETYEEIAKIKCGNLFCRGDIGGKGCDIP